MKGVVKAMPLSIQAESFWGDTGLYEVRRMTRFREAKKEDCNSVFENQRQIAEECTLIMCVTE